MRKVLQTLLVVAALAAATPLAGAAAAPGELEPVDCGTAKGAADVLFLFDLTGSMGGELYDAQVSAQQILDQILFEAPQTQFGVASFMDYHGYYDHAGYADWYGDASYGDYPWMLNQGITENTNSVRGAIQGLSLGSGEDWPESNTRALYETMFINWRPGVQKIVVLFADAPAHDTDFWMEDFGMNFGVDPGRDGIAGTADDLDYETVIGQLAEEGIQVFPVDASYGDDYAEHGFRYAADMTGGAYFLLDGSSQLSEVVVDLVVNAIRPGGSVAEAFSVSVTPVDQGYGTPAQVDRYGQVATPNGGSESAHAVDEQLGPLGLRARFAEDTAYGDAWQRGGTARAVSRGTGLELTTDLGLPVLRVDAFRTEALADAVPGSASASSGKSGVVGLSVLGIPIPAGLPFNTKIELPGIGHVTIMETVEDSGEAMASIRVNAVHAVLDLTEAGGTTKLDIVIGSAYAGATCGGAAPAAVEGVEGNGIDGPGSVSVDEDPCNTAPASYDNNLGLAGLAAGAGIGATCVQQTVDAEGHAFDLVMGDLDATATGDSRGASLETDEWLARAYLDAGNSAYRLLDATLYAESGTTSVYTLVSYDPLTGGYLVGPDGQYVPLPPASGISLPDVGDVTLPDPGEGGEPGPR